MDADAIPINLEGAIQTARVLLDEVTRIYKGGKGAEDGKLLVLVEDILKPYGLAHVFHPSPLAFTIERRRAA